MFRTYQTKLANDRLALPDGRYIQTYDYLAEYGAFFGQIERKLFVDKYVRKKDGNALKKHYCAVYGLTARQYNSIVNQLDGRVKAVVNARNRSLETLDKQIEQVETLLETKMKQKETTHAKVLKMKDNQPNFWKTVQRYRNIRHTIHQKNRRLGRLTEKRRRILADIEAGIVRLCFGSKQLFRQQFHLEENGLTKAEWARQWKDKRSSQCTFIGSKDETYGNQNCTYDTENNLRIRVYRQKEQAYGQYLVVPNVTFSYGQQHIDVAKAPYTGYTKGSGNKNTYYRALTHRFIRKGDTWYLNTTVDVDEADIVTFTNNGCISIDFNVGFLAVAELDRFGNVMRTFYVPYRYHHASSEQRFNSLSDALQAVVDYAVEQGKPLVHENLDFQKKKQQLKALGKKQAKTLSSFAYTTYQNLLHSKCADAGVEKIGVNPAYTSQIGHHVFMKRYGLSSHEAAAVVIGRRGLGFEVEKVPQSHWLKKPTKKTQNATRLKQWQSLHKQWKKHTFDQKIYALTRLS